MGSTNLDMRSLEMSDELSVGLLDEATAAALTAGFERDVARSREIRLEEWRQRSPWHRALDALSRLANEQL